MSKPKTFIAVAACALLASGCFKVGPDFEEPSATVSDAWLESENPAIDANRTMDRTWWAVFNDPVLDRLIDEAYQQNLTLVSTGVRVLQARAQLGVAIGNFYPQTQQAFGSLTYNRASERAAFATPASSTAFTYWEDQMGLQVAWEVDVWGKFRRAIESADASLLAAVASYDNALVSLTGDVASNYVQLRTLEARLQIARNNVEVQREGLQIAEIRFNGGTTTDRDVQQAKTVLASTQATIPQFDAAVSQTKNALSVLLGRTPSQLDELNVSGSHIPKAPVEVAVGIPADLLRRRPDIRSAELQAAAQSAQIGVAKADLYPSFSLTGNFGYLASDWTHYNLSDIFLAKSQAFGFGPSVQWNFLNYGRITNNVRAQDALFQALVADYQNTVLRAQQEVEDGLAAFLQAQRRTELLELSAEAARRSLELATLQYREGITDFTTVLTAEQNLLQQEDALAVSEGDIPAGLIRTFRALGGGWEIREDNDLVPADIRQAMARRTNWGKLLRAGATEQVNETPPSGLIPLPEF